MSRREASTPIGALVNVAALGRLGVGKLHKFDELGRAVVHFSGEGTRTLAPQTPLARARLSEATPVRFRGEDGEVTEGVIAEWLLERSDGGYLYRVRADDVLHEVWEGHIMPVGNTGDPLQLLKVYRWDTPRNFMARWAMADINARWFATSGGFPAMLGGRVLPLGHQIYAARRVLFDRAPRFILADEVGLGKTIEAGIIVQALQAEAARYRVLIIAPGSMSRQWLTETYLRFGARAYHHIDCARVIEDGRGEIDSLLQEERLIVASTALDAYPWLGQKLTAQDWDMVVVDEAHQIAPDHSLYPLLQLLGNCAPGLLLLSATPSKRDLTGLIGLLALVAPEAFADQASQDLQAKYDAQRGIWDRLSFTAKFIEAAAGESRNLDADELEFAAEQWNGLIEGDPFIDSLLARMADGDAEAALELIAYVQEFHRLDHRIVRTRRATLGNASMAWPERQLLELNWSPGPSEAMFLDHLEQLPAASQSDGVALRASYQNACATSADAAQRFLRARSKALDTGSPKGVDDALARLAGDAGPNDEPLLIADIVSNARPLDGEEAWLEGALALAAAWEEEGGFSRADRLGDWLADHLRDPAHQVIVFVGNAPNAEALADRLSARFGDAALGRFHAERDEEDLARTAFRFQHDASCRILVSDELGGEGRNFQNASAVVHFEIPISCARLEQRIGRLDRVGRSADRPVVSVVLEPPTREAAALLEVHRDVFGVFTRTIGGLEFVLPRLQRALAHAYGQGEATLRESVGEWQAAISAAFEASDEAFDLSLDATKPQLDHAHALAAQFDDGDIEATASTLRFWASRLGIQSKRLNDGSSEFAWSNGSLDITSDRLRIGSGSDTERRTVCGTFDRSQALASENLQFFAPGHALVDAMRSEAEHGRHSRVSAYLLPGFSKHKGTILLQVLGRHVLDEQLWQGHDITPGLAARARAMLWGEIVSEQILLWDGNPRHDLITHPGLRSKLDQPWRDGTLTALDATVVSDLPYLPSLWASIDQGVPIALASIAKRRQADAAGKAGQLEASFRAELGFLRWQASSSTSDEARAGFAAAMAAREALIASINQARVDLFGLSLVVLA